MRELGNLKDNYFLEHLEQRGVELYEAAITLVGALRAQQIKTAVVSSSNNCAKVLETTGIADLFDARVDGKDSDPFDVVGAIVLSRATLTKMHQNLWWAVAYNVVTFPLTAGVFYPFVISTEVAALAMSGSSALWLSTRYCSSVRGSKHLADFYSHTRRPSIDPEPIFAC